jgi:phosphoribosylanthranilate isomerase
MLIQIYEIQTPREAEALIELAVDHIGSVILDRDKWRNPEIREVSRLTAGTLSRSSLIPLFSDPDGVLRVLDYYEPEIIHFCENIPLPPGADVPLMVERTDNLRQLQCIVKEKFPSIQIIRSLPIPAAVPAGTPDVSVAETPCRPAPQRFLADRELEHVSQQAARRNAIAMLVDIFAPVSDFFMTDTVLGRSNGDNGGGDAAQPVAGFVGITGKVCDWDMARWLTKISPLPVILAGGLGLENVFDAICQTKPAGVDSCTRTNAVDSRGRVIRFRKDLAKVSRFIEEVRRGEMFMQK